MRAGALRRALGAAALLARQESGAAAGFSGRLDAAGCSSVSAALHTLHWAGADSLQQWSPLASPLVQAWQATPQRGMAGPVKRLTVKTTTKSHRFSHHIKIDREIELRRFWQEQRGVQNAAHLQRYINFSRIYARFRDLDYLPHTMRDWDAAIDRLFAHERGKQPANDLVRRHPYLLNVKILPLQFAKNAVKGKLPLYDWRAVLRDLREFVGEELPERAAQQQRRQQQQGRQQGRRGQQELGAEAEGEPAEPHFSHAKRTSASPRRAPA